MNNNVVPRKKGRVVAGWIILAACTIVAATAAAIFLFSRPPPRELVRAAPGTDNPRGEFIAGFRIRAQHHVEDFEQPIVQFESVFWEPRDTESLRRLLRETPLVREKSVLEIGTGTGLIALCCLQAGARHVVATDVNPAAVANVRYNAGALGVDDRLETRLVPLDRPTAFSEIGRDERFDLIISNPPWENRRPSSIAEYALYDENFSLLDSLLRDLPRHLNQGGRALLAYGSVDAIRQAETLASRFQLSLTVMDERSMEELPAVFLPGMLLEVRVEE